MAGRFIGILLGSGKIPLPEAIFMLQAGASLFDDETLNLAFARGFCRGMAATGQPESNIDAVLLRITDHAA